MKTNKLYIVVGLIIAFSLFSELAAHADESDQATTITFNQPIQIPGQVLPAVTVALEEYTKGNTDAVLLCYAKWISTLRQEPTVRVLIPAEIPKREGGQEGPRADYIYEPEPEAVLDGLLPRYVETQVFQAVLENKASEYSAKMIAMQNATNAAGDLINSLTLYANKVRQAGITTELMEIVSGTQAVSST